jgi:predicted metal-binding membrane protein
VAESVLAESRAEPRVALGEILLGERVVLFGGLGAIVALSWAWLWHLASEMAAMSPGAGPHTRELLEQVAMPRMGSMGAAWIFTMWVVMMGAMMLPTAAPMILMHARFVRGRDPSARTIVPSSLFALGYLVAWVLFSIAATLLQVVLEKTAWFSPAAMSLDSALAGGAVLAAAGVFQFTPLKNACLRQCRTPIGFFMTSWREGRAGALAMGVHHGLFCLGCCSGLMLVLFALGAMNLFWIAVLAAFVLIEKTAPGGSTIARAGGAALIVGGAALALSSVL